MAKIYRYDFRSSFSQVNITIFFVYCHMYENENIFIYSHYYYICTSIFGLKNITPMYAKNYMSFRLLHYFSYYLYNLQINKENKKLE